jgi:hypothetical protein
MRTASPAHVDAQGAGTVYAVIGLHDTVQRRTGATCAITAIEDPIEERVAPSVTARPVALKITIRNKFLIRTYRQVGNKSELPGLVQIVER